MSEEVLYPKVKGYFVLFLTIITQDHYCITQQESHFEMTSTCSSQGIGSCELYLIVFIVVPLTN